MPFLSQHNNTMLHTHNDGMSEFYSYLQLEELSGLRPTYQNGWELLAVNLGYFPNMETFAYHGVTNTHQDLPYIVLYNRYLGKIRFHGKVGDEWATKNYWQSIRVNLKIPDDSPNFSGLLRLAEGIDKSLNQNTTTTEYTALCEANNVKNQWFVAEFQVAFDPCVCNWPSYMQFDFNLVQNDNLTLHGGGITIQQEIVGGANGDELVHGDYLSNFKREINSDAEGGFVIYKDMQNMVDGYIDKLEAYQQALDSVNKHNKKVDRNLAILKWASLAVKLGAAVITSGGSHAATFALLSTEAPDLIISGDSIDVDKAFKEVEKILGKEVQTFISDNFKHQNPPAKPNRPTANFTEMYFQGNIQTSAYRPGPRLITPGAYGNSDTTFVTNPSRYPVYNEALGVFALLESPKLVVSQVEQNRSCSADTIISYHVNMFGDTIADTSYNLFVGLDRVTQIKLAEGLKYYLNPALNYKNVNIEVAFEINGKIYAAVSPLIGTKPTKNLPAANVNIESTAFSVELEDTLFVGSKIKYNSAYMPIDIMNDFVFSFGNRHEIHSIPIISYGPYANCTTLLDAYTGDKLNRFGIDSVQMLILLNIEYDELKSDGSPHDYTYMFRYSLQPNNIWVNDSIEIYPNLPGSAGDITQYPEDLYLNGVDFDGTAIDGCKLNGTTYLCKAWNDVEVTGTFSVANGYQVNVEAGNELRILPESMTPPEMTFSIAPVLDFSNPMPPVDPTFITAFCAPSGAYNARTSTKSLHEDTLEVAEDVAYPEFEDIFSLNLYPNPTGGNATLELTIGDRSVINLQVTDISGKPVVAPITNGIATAGVNRYELQTESLAKGIYFVHLVVNGEQHVKRLVKN
jgi:hypothetical protein